MKQTETNSREEKYSKIYALYYPKLVRFSEAYVLSFQDAENIVQDIFLYIWEHPEIIDSLTNMNAYLFTIAKNRCIDFLRLKTKERHKSITEIQHQEFQLKLYALQKFEENNLSDIDINTTIQNAINSLPEKCREIFLFSRMEGLRHKEIAERLNLSTNTIEGQIAIALQKLRKELKNLVPLFTFIIS